MPFFGNSPTDQTSRRIFVHDGSNDVHSRKDVPFLGFVDTAPHLRGKIPETPNFGGVNRHYYAELAKSKKHAYQNYCINSNHKFCTVIKTTKCPSWVSKHTHNKSKMADGRHREKSPYLGRGLTDFDQIWYGDAVRPS